MAEADPLAAWLEVVRELRALSELDEPGSAALPACPRLGSAQIAENDRRKMAERLATKGWGELYPGVGGRPPFRVPGARSRIHRLR